MEQPRSILTLYGERRWTDGGDENLTSGHIEHSLSSLTHYATALSGSVIVHSVSLSTHMYKSEYDQHFLLIASATIVYSGVIDMDFFNIYNINPKHHTAKVMI